MFHLLFAVKKLLQTLIVSSFNTYPFLSKD